MLSRNVAVMGVYRVNLQHIPQIKRPIDRIKLVQRRQPGTEARCDGRGNVGVIHHPPETATGPRGAKVDYAAAGEKPRCSFRISARSLRRVATSSMSSSIM